MGPAVYRQAVWERWGKSRIFPVQNDLWGAASLGQDNQKCACIRDTSPFPPNSVALSFVLGKSSGFFAFSALFFEVTFRPGGCVQIVIIYQKEKVTSSWFRGRDSLGWRGSFLCEGGNCSRRAGSPSQSSLEVKLVWREWDDKNKSFNGLSG